MKDIKQTTYRKDINGVEIYVGDYVAHSDGNGFEKKEGGIQKVYILRKVNFSINKENESISFILDSRANKWQGNHCEVFSRSKIFDFKIPIGKPFYFAENKVVVVSYEEYYRGRYRFKITKYLDDAHKRIEEATQEFNDMCKKVKNRRVQSQKDKILSDYKGKYI